MQKNANLKKLTGILKYPLTALLLYMVLSRLDYRAVKSIIINLEPGLIYILICISLLKLFFQYQNWQLFLLFFPDMVISKRERLLSFFAGTSLRVITPAGVGVYGRMLMLSMHKRDSFLAITYEKLIQGWGILLYAGIAAGIMYPVIPFFLKYLIPLLFISLPFLLLMINEKSPLHKYTPQNRKQLLPACGTQVIINFLTILQYYIFIGSFKDFSFLKALSSVPLVQFANLIPVTISGLGLREQIAMHIYPPLGISKELAISCSLFVFMISNLVPALVGLILIVTMKPGKKN
ncbi:MAG: flippase-like domain-containing protein [Candidatus Cloacimonetes bacterium]|nr:flippase-like domain-containing protein [Candidatus Cloacimonadota bacterium]